ncbi:ATP-binding protein [Variovorax atrisoli]|uniref:ATP-binding protein n=1 Tax=Variovorax atrisoli TaxID=3394203 RepID=UPI003396C21E
MTQFDQHAVSLPEYEDHPFIQMLPPIYSMQEWAARLRGQVVFDARERNFPAKLRKHCVLRLLQYFEPMERQIRLAERLDMMIRQGYMGRNPLAPGYAARLAGGVRQAMAGTTASNVIPFFHPSALSFALTGCSGVGKTRAEEQILRQYPQIIVHPGLQMTQLSWIKLESPQKGGPKQLCIDFFIAVDRLLGTGYFKLYGKGSEDEMVVHMAEVATNHAIGLLVVDEIQHLKHARSGAGEEVLSFVVKLVNTIGVPVELIGTPSAVDLLQGNFRQGRRSSGLGALRWDPMPQDRVWTYFLEKMWAFQWTREATPLTPALSAALYEETQGVTDLVVKIFMLAQMRLISAGEVSSDAKEVITPALIRRVAREDFWLVAPMIRALRLKDSKALAKYDDLQSLHQHVNGILQGAVSSSTVVQLGSTEGLVPTADPQPASKRLVDALCSFGVSPDIAQVVVQGLGEELENVNPLDLLKRVTLQMEVGTAPTAPGTVPANKPPELDDPKAASAKPQKAKTSKKVAAKSVGDKNDEATVVLEDLPPADLRRIAAQAQAQSRTPYEAFRESNVVAFEGQGAISDQGA